MNNQALVKGYEDITQKTEKSCWFFFFFTQIGIANFYFNFPLDISTRIVFFCQKILTNFIFLHHRNIIPDNVVEATFRQTQTKYSHEIVEQIPLVDNSTRQNISSNQNSTIQMVKKLVKSVGKTDGPNILGIFALFSS